MMKTSILRRAVLALGLALAAGLFLGGGAATAAETPAETFVADNIHKGLDILSNKSLPTAQRREQFEQLLLNLTDMKRIALFTLGRYRRTAPAADVDTFVSAFQNYAVAVYESYFSRYAGQTLKIIGSTRRSPTDFIVQTHLINPNDHSGQPPLEVDFRVRTDTGKPVVTDFSVAGIWLALEERDQFTAFLGQNNGNVRLLATHLNELAKQFK